MLDVLEPCLFFPDPLHQLYSPTDFFTISSSLLMLQISIVPGTFWVNKTKIISTGKSQEVFTK